MENYSNKLFYRIALTQIEGVGDILARHLLKIIGQEEDIFKTSVKALTAIKGISSNLAAKIRDKNVLLRSEKELSFILKNNIQTYFYQDEGYPDRLKECADAPILLYYKGNADLKSKKIISVVGTRKATEYGMFFCHSFLSELSLSYPDALIVSGLAYGIDICAHRSALANNLSTVGVLAHGLDRIYPQSHRRTAIDMLSNGGLLTEFISDTVPDKFNFVRRNRIVAGLSDATIVVESEKKGGSLITADLANGYNREVFAVPGRFSDKESVGCNDLIEQNKAILLQSVDKFLQQMGWEQHVRKKERLPIQNQLHFDLSEDELSVHHLLNSLDSVHLNFLLNQTGMSISSLLPLLLDMEVKGVVKALPGSYYKINSR